MIILRDATLSDYLSIARLHAQNWQQHYRGIYSDHYLDHEAEEERAAAWHERLATPPNNQQVIVAMQDNTLVGFACLFMNENPTFGSYLDNLHVAGSMQKEGVGKRLLQAVAQRILHYGGSAKLYLWVYEANEKARRVYEHLGAVHIETVKQPTKDGATARTCRYAWTDVSVLV
jgi:GNAT superfamily N-acetyltransferase